MVVGKEVSNDEGGKHQKGGLKVSDRAEQMASFIVMDVLDAANDRERSGKPVYHMEVGQPGTGAPTKSREAVQGALMRAEQMGYTAAAGLLSLRQRIVHHYADTYGFHHLHPGRLFVTSGSSAGFTLVFAAAFNPGDRVAVASPGYPCYRNVLRMLSIIEVPIPVDASTNFQPTVSLLQQASEDGPLAGLIVASPSNPTGTMLHPEELHTICKYCDQTGIRLISDEIYHGITYGTRQQATAVSFSDSAIVINSFSKYYCMAGWRVGWVIVPEELIEAVNKVQQNAFINAPTISQIGAEAAMDCTEELDANIETYRRNRALLLEGLPKAGMPVSDMATSDGAFYLYVDVSRYTTDSLAFCRKVLEETGVACTPGVDFDQQRGWLFCRFSFCQRTEAIQAAISALQDWLPQQPRLK
eukprot:GGOE01061889.1.p1 GENE.GGOE01061889.1~~GGOE01061889.1.p1  ORF type:complete len:414 (+),score=84.44 GGOE01061889.1:179-1420(+)